MPYLLPLSIVHLAALIWLCRATARRLFGASILAWLSAATLAWVNLVLTALVASCVGRLGSPPVYFATSLALAFAAHRFFRRACPVIAPASEPTVRDIARQIRGSSFALGLVALLIVILTGVSLISVAVLPNNWDTLAYRFPRAFFYLSSGALVHAAESLDPRLLYYPYNGALLHLFLAQYQWPPMAWNAIAVGAWLLTGAAGLQLALAMGGSARAASISAYAVLTTPIVLCLANSTNDELLASAPLAMAIAFAVQWYRGPSPQALILAALAGGLALGVKLHWLVLVPWLALGAVWLGVQRRRSIVDGLRRTVRLGSATVVAAVTMVLACGFLATNYLSTQRWIDSEHAAAHVNRPFRFDVARQTFGIFSTQMLLSPLPDHVRAFGVEPGRRAYSWANEKTMDLLFRDVQQGPPFTVPHYRVRGLVEPGAEAFFEQSVWLGLVPHAALASLAWLAWRRRSGTRLAAYLLAALPMWHATFPLLYRYVETAGTYWAYPVPLFAAGLGPVWEWSRNSGHRGDRIVSALLVVMLASNAVLAGTMLLSNQRRNVLQAFERTNGETPTTQTSPRVRSLVREARRVAIPYTHWELLYWNLMRLNPAARYFVERESADVDLKLYSLARRLDENFGLSVLPARAGERGTVRLAGTMSSGSDVVFCSGPVCESVCSECDRYVLLPLGRGGAPGEASWFVGGQAPPRVARLQGGAVRLTFLGRRRHVEVVSPWIDGTTLAASRFGFPRGGFTRLSIEISSRPDGGGEIARTDLRFDDGILIFEP